MRYIKSFNELRVVNQKLARTGNKRIVNRIFDDPEDPKAYSASLLLKDQLERQQFDDILSGIDNAKVKSYLKKLSNDYDLSKALLAANNYKFLSDVRKKKEDLYCAYCKRGPLVYRDEFEDSNEKWLSTVDHKQPINLGGDKYSYDNLAVCCQECNYDKGNMSYSEWMDELPFYLDKRSGLGGKKKKSPGQIQWEQKKAKK